MVHILVRRLQEVHDAARERLYDLLETDEWSAGIFRHRLTIAFLLLFALYMILLSRMEIAGAHSCVILALWLHGEQALRYRAMKQLCGGMCFLSFTGFLCHAAMKDPWAAVLNFFICVAAAWSAWCSWRTYSLDSREPQDLAQRKAISDLDQKKVAATDPEVVGRPLEVKPVSQNANGHLEGEQEQGQKDEEIPAGFGLNQGAVQPSPEVGVRCSSQDLCLVSEEPEEIAWRCDKCGVYSLQSSMNCISCGKRRSKIKVISSSTGASPSPNKGVRKYEDHRPPIRYGAKSHCCCFISGNCTALCGFFMLVLMTSTVLAAAIGKLAYGPPSWSPDHTGRMVQIPDGRWMHIDCMGTGSPTVVLITGWTMEGYAWLTIRKELAKYTRTCLYDRAGIGWSDRGPPRDWGLETEDLSQLLDAAGEKPPFLHVGYSMGTFAARMLSARRQADTCAFILVDPVSEIMMKDLNVNEYSKWQTVLFWAPVVFFWPLGLGLAASPFEYAGAIRRDGCEEPAEFPLETYRVMHYNNAYWKNVWEEWRAMWPAQGGGTLKALEEMTPAHMDCCCDWGNVPFQIISTAMDCGSVCGTHWKGLEQLAAVHPTTNITKVAGSHLQMFHCPDKYWLIINKTKEFIYETCRDN